MRTLHALLFAIDHYPIPAHRLAGCRNDLAAMDAFLAKFCHSRNLEYRKLIRTDAEVTRRGFAEGFAHFEAAEPGDIALLFYGGHGSQAPAPPAFWSVDPDRRLETIVCHDSRTPGGRDLTDKEIGHLIARATRGKDLHVVAIFDCCHSGTLSRAPGVTVRKLQPQPRGPALEDLLGAADYPPGEGEGQRLPPTSRHIALSAARSYQTAKELRLGGQQRGMFTASLIEVLEAAGAAPLSYQTLMQRVGRKVEGRVDDQDPQWAAFAGFDPRSPFLGTAGLPSRPAVHFDPEYGWTLPFGSVHRVKPGGAVHLKDPEGGTREARVDRPGRDFASLDRMGWADEGQAYEVLSFEQALPHVGIAFHPTLAERSPDVAETLALDHWPQALIECPVPADEADYWIDLDAERGLILTRPNRERPLFHTPEAIAEEGWEKALSDFVVRVSRVANAHRLSEWANPREGLDPRKALEISFEKREGSGPFEPLEPGEPARLEYVYEGSAWRKPAFRLRIGNATEHPLWVGALYFSEDFGITDAFLPMREILPSDAPHPFAITDADTGQARDTISLELPDRIHSWGQTRIQNRLKIVVSREEIDLSGFTQEPLELEGRARGLLDFLWKKPAEAAPDWATLDLDLHIHRPLGSGALEEGRALRLREVTIEGPAGFRARAVRLSSSAEQARTRGLTPPSAIGDGEHLLPFDLGGARNLGDALDVIEMHGAAGEEHIDAEHPITLRLDHAAVGERQVVPFGFDQEEGFYLPLGYTDEEGAIRIEALPDEDPSTARGLTKSLKIYLQQFIHSTFSKKEEAPYPILAAATGQSEDTMAYEDDASTLRRQVADAERILLLLHGLVGDTSDQRNILHRARRNKNGQTVDLSSCYDLLLCFDYESLGTSIEDNARLLRQKLESLGLGPGHGKDLILVAHSMGGLVSRWFIEREGGREMVRAFVQVGSPNLGSPWARVYDWTTLALGKAINFLPIPGLINELLGKFKSGVELSSLQMLPDSPFLRNLNSHPPDPGMPYYLLAGDSERLNDPGSRQRKFLAKFVGRFRGTYRDKLEKWLFRGEHDDIVSLESMYGAPDFPESRVERIGPVGCHHFSYFIEPESVETLGGLLFRLADETSQG